jgi:hypothetical protein
MKKVFNRGWKKGGGGANPDKRSGKYGLYKFIKWKRDNIFDYKAGKILYTKVNVHRK